MDARTEPNCHMVSLYETSEKDTELSSLSLQLEYLSVEEDVRPVRLKFHSYPVKVGGEGLEGLVETDEDIATLFGAKERLASRIDSAYDEMNKSLHSAIDKDRSSIHQSQGKASYKDFEQRKSQASYVENSRTNPDAQKSQKSRTSIPGNRSIKVFPASASMIQPTHAPPLETMVPFTPQHSSSKNPPNLSPLSRID